MSRRTSVSRLTSIARCGTAYELKRVQQLPALPAGWTIQGIAVHDAADAWEKSHRKMDVLDVQEVFKRSWRAELSKADARFPERTRWLVGGRKKVTDDLMDRYNGGLDQVARYIEYNLQDDKCRPYTMPDGSIAAEVGFEIEFQGVAVLGYLDLLMEDVETGALIVRDIKTGANVPVVPFQLLVYRMAVADVLGLDVQWGEFFMTRRGVPGPPIDLTRLDQSLIKEWFTRQVEIEKGNFFLPNPGDSCRTCEVSIHCPLMK